LCCVLKRGRFKVAITCGRYTHSLTYNETLIISKIKLLDNSFLLEWL